MEEINKMNLKEYARSQDLDELYPIEQAESIVRELKQGLSGFMSLDYLDEKIRNIKDFLEMKK